LTTNPAENAKRNLNEDKLVRLERIRRDHPQREVYGIIDRGIDRHSFRKGHIRPDQLAGGAEIGVVNISHADDRNRAGRTSSK